MSRTTNTSNKEILIAARHMFLEKGPGVGTAEIAQRLGISDATIFKRFSTKRKLFVAAMDVDEKVDWKQDLGSLVGQGDLRENLVCLLSELAAMFQERLPRIMLLWSDRGDTASHLDVVFEPNSSRQRMIEAFTDYLAREMRIGRLRQSAPSIVVQLLIGAVWNVAFQKALWDSANSSDEPHIQVVELVEKIVGTMWRGIAPDASR
jgi:AcrR family transcriptional regulator